MRSHGTIATANAGFYGAEESLGQGLRRPLRARPLPAWPAPPNLPDDNQGPGPCRSPSITDART